MMAFGRDQMLKKDEVDNVVAYVRSLSDPAVAKDVPAAKIDAGKAVFAANCVACHGDDAKGKADLGGPDLTDRFWIYGGDAEFIANTVWGGRQGQMPSWDGEASRRSIARSSRSICSICAGRPMSGAGRSDAPFRTRAVVWAVGRCRAAAGADRQCASGLYGRHVATGLRRAYTPGRGRRGTESSAPRGRHARRDEIAGRPTMTSIPAVVPPLPREHTWKRNASPQPRLRLALGRLARLHDPAGGQHQLRRAGISGVGRHRRRPVCPAPRLYPVSRVCGLHGGWADNWNRTLRKEPAHRGRRPVSLWNMIFVKPESGGQILFAGVLLLG